MILSKPSCGWATFKLGNCEAQVSYTTDVPLDVLYAAKLYERTGNAIIVFDREEDGEFALAIYGNRVLLIGFDPDNENSIDEFRDDDGLIMDKLLSSIACCVDDWAAFLTSAETEDDIQRNAVAILSLLMDLHNDKSSWVVS